MCYKSVPAFEADDGSLFKTEPDAIVHSVMALLDCDEAQANRVLDNASGLLPHIQRTIVLASAIQAKHLAPATSGKDPGKDPTEADHDPAARRSALLGRLQRWAQAVHIAGDVEARDFIKKHGYEALTEINLGASDEDIETMHAELDAKGVK
jgi:hypothetical protein